MRNVIQQDRLHFEGACGNRLAARLDRPRGRAPRAFALFAHCFACSKDLKGAHWISRALAMRGFGVLRFDFTGLGESEGDFSETDFSSNLDDIVAAAEFLAEHDSPPKLLVGHSLGGAAVLAAAARIPSAVAVATIGAPSDTGHLRKTLLQLNPEVGRHDEAEIKLAGRTLRIKRRLLDDLDAHCLESSIESLGKALLVMHSPVDEVVPIEHARRIYQAARHPKSFLSLDDADHLLVAREEDAKYAAEVLAAWAGRYVGASPELESTPAAPGSVNVTGGASGLTQTIRAGGHEFLADEPLSAGGHDLGPTPYDLLLAALGACTSMTLRMYAERKGWPLESVDVELTHRRIHADDCRDCETVIGRVDEIERTVRLAGDLDNDQLERLHEIANRCPVHRTLTTETKIRSRRG